MGECIAGAHPMPQTFRSLGIVADNRDLRYVYFAAVSITLLLLLPFLFPPLISPSSTFAPPHLLELPKYNNTARTKIVLATLARWGRYYEPFSTASVSKFAHQMLPGVPKLP